VSDRGEWRWGQPRSAFEDQERDVDAEIAFHLEARVEENLARGLSLEDARAEAEARFGRVAAIRHDLLGAARTSRSRRRWRDALLDFGRDVRLAARGLARRPAFHSGRGSHARPGDRRQHGGLQPRGRARAPAPAGIGTPDALARVWFVLPSLGSSSMGEGTAIIPHPYLLDLEHTAPAVASLAGVTRSTVHVAVPAPTIPDRGGCKRRWRLAASRPRSSCARASGGCPDRTTHSIRG
jgi:hypothetical protein